MLYVTQDQSVEINLPSKAMFVPNRKYAHTIKVVKSTTAMVVDSKGVGCSTVPC